MPTVNCLVELVEAPATVVAMPAVAIVNLERVGFNLRNFDMVIVFKVSRLQLHGGRIYLLSSGYAHATNAVYNPAYAV